MAIGDEKIEPMNTLCEYPLVSLIIRTKNEERWIGSCLKAVFGQSYANIEVVLVDNCSTDQTIRKARDFSVKLVEVSEFFPGKAINEGIRVASGDILVCLSGHCIPTNSYWLENLIRNLSEPTVAGVYGRQEPLSFTSDLDKRDLLTVFGLDKKVQIKDSFIHNANSAFRRQVWEAFPFDETVSNIEDRLWGEMVIAAGMKIVYEPDASVYHWHGINHDLNPERARNIVRILEKIDGMAPNMEGYDSVGEQDVIVVIPIRGKSCHVNEKSLLEYTLDATRGSELIRRVFVSTDDPETIRLAQSLGDCIPILRPPDLSEDFVDVIDVLKYSLSEIERFYGVPDLVVLLEETYPFRPPQLLDEMIRHVVKDGLDTLIAAKPESRGVLLDVDGRIEVLGEGFMPSGMKKNKALIGLLGLACVSHPAIIRNGDILGSRLGVFEVDNPHCSLQIRNGQDVAFAEKFLSDWWGNI